jgi:NADP-dependent 3-hydroxy acid dehydrogenase YdfG
MSDGPSWSRGRVAASAVSADSCSPPAGPPASAAEAVSPVGTLGGNVPSDPHERTTRERGVVVSGASGGIGRAIALALAERGAALWLLGRRPEELERTAIAATRAGARLVEPIAIDLRDEDEIASIPERLGEEALGLDTVVNSAGTITLGDVADAGVDVLDEHYRTNLRAPYALTRQLLPQLRRRGGDVVFVNSTAALGPRRGRSAYAASYAALRSMADSLRDEVNADGVRVLTVFAGRTATTMQEELHTLEGRRYDADRQIQPSDMAATILTMLELPRTAEVTDISIRPALKPARWPSSG